MPFDVAKENLTEAHDLVDQLDRASHVQVSQLLARLHVVLDKIGAELDREPEQVEQSERIAKFMSKPLGFALANTFLDIKTHADQQVVLSVALMAANRDALGGGA